MVFSFNSISLKFYKCAIVWLAVWLVSDAQDLLAQGSTIADIAKISSGLDSLRTRLPVEKLYLHFDKPYYALGDTIWFKAYLVNSYLMPSNKSGLLYVELSNDSNVVIKRMMLPVAAGMSWGDIPLNGVSISEGKYTVRAYTNWMRNFGEEYIFSKRFDIAKASDNQWLINYKVVLKQDSILNKAQLSLQFYNLKKEPLILKGMRITTMSSGKVIYKANMHTGMDGSLRIEVPLKNHNPLRDMTIVAEDIEKGITPQRVNIPVIIHKDNVDLQFMPEGGNLVAAMPAHIGFKAIGEDGLATDVKGVVYNKMHQQIAVFNALHKGMGSFDFIPQMDEIYSANVTLPDGVIKSYLLPHVHSSGTSLKVRNIAESDSMSVTVMATPDVQKLNNNYFLIAQSRGVVCYALSFKFLSEAIKIKVPKNVFPSGIGRFTLINDLKQPLNERLFFLNHNDDLKISITADKLAYSKRDSISMNVMVTDGNGNPVKGNFSLAVTDDNQVKQDSIKANNINSHLLLTSDLKGEIEDPAYYFQPDSLATRAQHLDNLLLTQGWIGYSWNDVLSPAKKAAFNAEKEFVIDGKVSNIFHKALPKVNVILFSNKPQLIKETITDNTGHFIFKDVLPIDTPQFMLQARNKNGKSFNVKIDMEEFQPPVFAASDSKGIPWYINTDTTVLRYIKNNTSYREAQEFPQSNGKHALKEVKIIAKKIIKDSQNLNGPGNADQVIAEKQLEKADKKTWLALLHEKVPGFAEKSKFVFVPPIYKLVHWYEIKGEKAHIFVDGILVTYSSSDEDFNDTKDVLRSHIANDIKGIEVMSSYQYSTKYVLKYNLKPFDAIVEITTRSGKGLNLDYTPGTTMYKPLPYSLPAQFYRPKYTRNMTASNTDLRSTLHWEPNIITDKTGRARVSFFSSDQTGTYTAILEGWDMKGNIGNKQSNIIVR